MLLTSLTLAGIACLAIFCHYLANSTTRKYALTPQTSFRWQVALCAILATLTLPGHASTNNYTASLFDLSLEQLMDIEVVTASRQPEARSRSVGTTYVVTADELRQLGARTIYDALSRLPGFNVTVTNEGINAITMRGVTSINAEKILFMVDGHILNDSRSGGANIQFLDNLPVENIKRIELVQGPGSSLYGANAFLGMINIITLQGEDVDGVVANVKTEFESGNHVYNRYNLLAGKRFDNGWQGSFNLSGQQGDGATLKIDQDAFGRSGEADAEQEIADLYFRLSNDNLSLNGRYYYRRGGGFYGVGNVLNDDTEVEVQYGYLDITYLYEATSTLDINIHAAIDHQNVDNYYEVFPAGSIPGGSPLSPWNGTGFIGNNRSRETNNSADVRADYSGIKNHMLSFGSAYRHEKLYDPKLFANFNPGFLPTVQNVSDTFNFIEPDSRGIWSAYAQDIWDLSDTVRLSTDVRYDRYSDFGSTFNPRIGLSWQMDNNYQLKLLYGTAYRAPDFISLNIKNNPVFLGNPNLDAEEITTYEVGVVATLSQRLRAEATFFYNELKQLIGAGSGSPSLFENTDNVETTGIEGEVRYNFTNGVLLRANYTYVNLNEDSDYPYPTVPSNSGNLVIDIPIGNKYHWNFNIYAQSNSDRSPTDTRGSMGGYAIANTTVNAKLSKDMELQLAVYNLNDKDYAYPSQLNTTPGDYTAPGRSYLLGLNYNFK